MRPDEYLSHAYIMAENKELLIDRRGCYPGRKMSICAYAREARGELKHAWQAESTDVKNSYSYLTEEGWKLGALVKLEKGGSKKRIRKCHICLRYLPYAKEKLTWKSVNILASGKNTCSK